MRLSKSYMYAAIALASATVKAEPVREEKPVKIWYDEARHLDRLGDPPDLKCKKMRGWGKKRRP